jgi:hypothetical protein
VKTASDPAIELELCRLRVKQIWDDISKLREERDRARGLRPRMKVWLEKLILDELPQAEARLVEAERRVAGASD